MMIAEVWPERAFARKRRRLADAQLLAAAEVAAGFKSFEKLRLRGHVNTHTDNSGVRGRAQGQPITNNARQLATEKIQRR